jgi:hypothetical protein
MDREVDFGVCTFEPEQVDLEVIELYTDTLVAVFAAGHRIEKVQRLNVRSMTWRTLLPRVINIRGCFESSLTVMELSLNGFRIRPIDDPGFVRKLALIRRQSAGCRSIVQDFISLALRRASSLTPRAPASLNVSSAVS